MSRYDKDKGVSYTVVLLALLHSSSLLAALLSALPRLERLVPRRHGGFPRLLHARVGVNVLNVALWASALCASRQGTRTHAVGSKHQRVGLGRTRSAARTPTRAGDGGERYEEGRTTGDRARARFGRRVRRRGPAYHHRDGARARLRAR